MEYPESDKTSHQLNPAWRNPTATRYPTHATNQTVATMWIRLSIVFIGVFLPSEFISYAIASVKGVSNPSRDSEDLL